MARNRYVKDYRLIETVDERGRIRSSYEYIGAPYRFEAEGETLRKSKKRALALCPLLWLLFVAAMLPDSQAMRTMYVALPFVFSALPLGILTDILLSVCRAKEPLEHIHADKANNRLPPAALFSAVLPGASLLGELLRLILAGGMNGGDWLYAVFCLLLCLGSACVFSLRRALAVRQTK